MDSTEIGILIGSALLHQAFFQSISGDTRGDGAKLKSCYLSHLHCAVAVTSCMVYWATQPVELSSATWMIEGPEGRNSQWMRYTIAFSVGYLINDLFLMVQHPVVGGGDMIVHHIVCIAFWSLGVFDRCCTPYHFLLFIEELSTPFLNVRWQYRNEKNSTTYQVAQTGFVLLFFFTRIVIGTGMLVAYNLVHVPGFMSGQPFLKQLHIGGQLAAWAFSRLLNFFWFYKIIKIAVRGGRTTYMNEDKIA
mmetsp:Transcript_42211/g.100213  ORF Transcript_42211/g.100213 Transcript_42211/m.100213 type:complete len:248 (+) Transcript_42211:107-850(+)